MRRPSRIQRSTFDVVRCWHTLEHVADPGTLLQRLRDAVSETGVDQSSPAEQTKWNVAPVPAVLVPPRPSSPFPPLSPYRRGSACSVEWPARGSNSPHGFSQRARRISRLSCRRCCRTRDANSVASPCALECKVFDVVAREGETRRCRPVRARPRQLEAIRLDVRPQASRVSLPRPVWGERLHESTKGDQTVATAFVANSETISEAAAPFAPKRFTSGTSRLIWIATLMIAIAATRFESPAAYSSPMFQKSAPLTTCPIPTSTRTVAASAAPAPPSSSSTGTRNTTSTKNAVPVTTAATPVERRISARTSSRRPAAHKRESLGSSAT